MNLWGITDRGNVRTQNQDYFSIVRFDEQNALAVVCDGMGGAKAGNVASRLAADAFVAEVKRTWKPDLDEDGAKRILHDAAEIANQAVYEHAQISPDYTGMGTTLVAMLLAGERATVVNIGDSRAYLLNERGIQQITVDHSVVQMMVRRGDLTQEQARTYPGKNLITRAVGTESAVTADLFSLQIRQGDCLLLCSDGLSNLMTDQEILFEVIHAVHKDKCCRHLLKIAMDRGAPDNITVILAVIE